MDMPVGKFKNKSLELLLLKEPEYVYWILNDHAISGPLLPVRAEFKRLIAIFDKKPIHKKCFGASCPNTASRASLYINTVDPFWWCDDCDIYSRGAFDGKLKIVSTYKDAIDYVSYLASTPKSNFKDIIKSFAEAKGLGKRVGEKQAINFFYEDSDNNSINDFF